MLFSNRNEQTPDDTQHWMSLSNIISSKKKKKLDMKNPNSMIPLSIGIWLSGRLDDNNAQGPVFDPHTSTAYIYYPVIVHLYKIQQQTKVTE